MSNADIKDMQPPADFSREGKGGKIVAIFCWSRTEEGSDRWNEAERIGHLCISNGFSVVTGGYCGSMEAVSKGAKAAKGTTEASKNAEVIGILVPSQFPHRKLVGNPYLTQSVDSLNLCNRLHILTASSRYFLLLPGTLGSLTELLIIWSLALLGPPGTIRPMIICMRDPWEQMVKHIEADLKLPPNEAQLLSFVDTVEEAMDLILNDAALAKTAEVVV